MHTIAQSDQFQMDSNNANKTDEAPWCYKWIGMGLMDVQVGVRYIKSMPYTILQCNVKQ